MNGITLAFDEGDKIIEIGGGTEGKAIFHPNIDIRAGPGADIVCDIGKERLPFENGSLDGIFSNYCIEHVSWKQVRFFISECFRVLKRGGRAYFITANLYEQCKKVAEAGDEGLNEDLVCMIFGGQGGEGIEAGSHKCGFSPKYACKLFSEAGFSKVNVYEHPAAITDMVIESIK